MPRRGRKGEQHIFIRQRSGERFCAHVVADKDDVLRSVRPQGIEDRIDLRIAHHDEDHIVSILRLQLGYHRNPADRYAGREFILDPQAVLPDLLRLASPRQQGYVLSGAKQISCKIAAEHAGAEYQNFHG